MKNLWSRRKVLDYIEKIGPVPTASKPYFFVGLPFTGTQYLNTKKQYTGGKLRFIFTIFKRESESVFSTLLSIGETTDAEYLRIDVNGSQMKIKTATTEQLYKVPLESNRDSITSATVEVIFDNNNCTVQGRCWFDTSTIIPTTTLPCGVIPMNKDIIIGSTDNNSYKGFISTLQILQDTDRIFYGRSCWNLSNGESTLYDEISKTYCDSSHNTFDFTYKYSGLMIEYEGYIDDGDGTTYSSAGMYYVHDSLPDTPEHGPGTLDVIINYPKYMPNPGDEIVNETLWFGYDKIYASGSRYVEDFEYSIPAIPKWLGKDISIHLDFVNDLIAVECEGDRYETSVTFTAAKKGIVAVFAKGLGRNYIVKRILAIDKTGVIFHDARPVTTYQGENGLINVINTQYTRRNMKTAYYNNQQCLPYLETDGTAFFDTGYIPNDNTSIIVSFHKDKNINKEYYTHQILGNAVSQSGFNNTFFTYKTGRYGTPYPNAVINSTTGYYGDTSNHFQDTYDGIIFNKDTVIISPYEKKYTHTTGKENTNSLIIGNKGPEYTTAYSQKMGIGVITFLENNKPAKIYIPVIVYETEYKYQTYFYEVMSDTLYGSEGVSKFYRFSDHFKWND